MSQRTARCGPGALVNLGLRSCLILLLVLYSQPAASSHSNSTTIIGNVRDSRSNAIEGALITLSGEDRRFVVTARTDADGRFAIHEIPSGSYSLSTSKADHFMIADSGEIIERSDVAVPFGAETLTVNLLLRKGARLAGKITDWDDAPVAGVFVRLRRGSPLSAAVATPTTHSDVFGNFELRGVPPGAFVVEAAVDQVDDVDRQRLSRFESAFFPNAVELQQASTIDVGFDDSVDGLNISLKPRKRFVVSGRIIEMGTTPARLRLVSSSADHGLVRTAVADEFGAFTLIDVPPGTYVVTAIGANSKDETIAAYQQVIVAGDMSDMALQMLPTGKLRGTLVFDWTVPPRPYGLLIAPVLTYGQNDADPLRPDEIVMNGAGNFEINELVGTRNVRVIGLPDGCRVARITDGALNRREPHVSIRPGRTTSVAIHVTCRL